MALPSSTSTLPETLTNPPFITIEGIANFRDVGNHYQSTSGGGGNFVRPSYLFRSAEPTRVTDKGKEELRDLGIKKVFDFRSKAEIEKYHGEAPIVEGVEWVRCPVSEKEGYDPVSMAKVIAEFDASPVQAFAKMYGGIMENGGPAFETVLRHIKDHPDQPCLVHCTAGKDRTGVFSAIFLKLLGVSDDDIGKDYQLTEVGLKPLLPALIKRFQTEQAFRDNWEAALKMSAAEPETIIRALNAVQEKYGSVEGYLKVKTTLTDEDLTAIKKSVLVKA